MTNSNRLSANDSEVTPAAWLFGYRICPPARSLTLAVSPLPLSVVNPMDQPEGRPLVDGKVTVSPLAVLKLDRTVPLSASVAAYPALAGYSQFPGQSRLSTPFAVRVVRG